MQIKTSYYYQLLTQNKKVTLLVISFLVLIIGLLYLYLQSGLRVINVIPSSGKTETPDTFQILVFDFSEPIDTTTAVIETDPPRIVKTLDLPDYPYRLSIMPAINGWEPNIEYIIKLSGIVAQDGTKLRRPITFKYLNTFDFTKIYEDAPY